MSNLTLFHGSDHIIEKPDFHLGKTNNDYGRGFYCTEELEMAKEWACKQNNDGFANKYILLKNRTFRLSSEIAEDARQYIIRNFSIDLDEYDIVIGYRADDSYFSFAESFIQNGIPLRSLNQALRLGKLGAQTVLISENSFANLHFIGAESVEKSLYYSKFIERDSLARKTYREEIRNSITYQDDIFVLDILREEMTKEDVRIQRIVSE